MTALRFPEPISAPGLPRADAGFQRMYTRHEPALLAYCRGILRDEHDARDALQNTALRALVALRGGDVLLNERAWLFRIAHNESVSLLRARRPAAELDGDTLPGGAEPEAAALLREHVGEVMQDLGALAPRARQALWLREVLGLGYGEIARVLDVREGAARQAVSEARAALRADRTAREEDCAVVRAVLTLADGRRRRGRTARAHMRGCASCRAWRDEQRGGRGRFLVLPLAALRWASELLRPNAVEGLVTGRLTPRGAGALAGLAVGAAALGGVAEQPVRHTAVRHGAPAASAPVRSAPRASSGEGVQVSRRATHSVVRVRAAAPAAAPAPSATLSAPRKATKSGFGRYHRPDSAPVVKSAPAETTRRAPDQRSPSPKPASAPAARPQQRDSHPHSFAPQQHPTEPEQTAQSPTSPLPQPDPSQAHTWAPSRTGQADGGDGRQPQLPPDNQATPTS